MRLSANLLQTIAGKNERRLPERAQARQTAVAAAVYLLLAVAGLTPSAFSADDFAEDIEFPALSRYENVVKEKQAQAFIQKRQRQYADIALLFRQAPAAAPDRTILLYLRATQLIRRMWSEQADPRLSQLYDSARRAILAVPPPPQYTDAEGRLLTLIGKDRDAVYLGTVPIADADLNRFRATPRPDAASDRAPTAEIAVSVTVNTAAAFCKWLSAQHGHTYALPTAAVLGRAGIAYPCALWTATEWDGPDTGAARARRQFGVRMLTVWDPDERLGSGPLPGELPFAAYPELGFTVTVAPVAAIQDRLNRLQRQLPAE